jgi:Mn2+/Fe2+ NRAMP family transporter
MVRPPVGAMAADFFVPRLPEGGPLSEVMLLIIGIVGTTVAPWQLFFQQSYVIDKRIPPRFIPYERADQWIGIVFVTVGAIALMGVAAATFAGRPEFGMFSDAGAVASGLEKYVGRVPAVLFALALLDACLIGASAVSLSTAYAVSDVLDLRHSLHRKPTEAKAFYAVYCGLVALAAVLVLTPGTPLGLLTNAVQTLAGVLLPSATVFLLLLCNDEAVLGPWVNGRWLNLFTGGVNVVLVLLSIILTASVLFPGVGSETITAILGLGSLTALVVYLTVGGLRRLVAAPVAVVSPLFRDTWRMPPLAQLRPRRLTTLNRVWLVVLRVYLIVAAGLVVVRIVTLATSGA